MSMGEKELRVVKKFVAGLSEREAREELILAYRQMELCLDVLKGKKGVKPIVMKDNGLSSDLELFYRCKEVIDSF